MDTKNKKIGFIGQGWIGKNYADNFEARGFEAVRYALEAPYFSNKEKIKDCDIVFIAVPTPSTPAGFDFSIVESMLGLLVVGQSAVIKSTILPGTAKKLQAKYPELLVFYSPEFLSEATVVHDVANPFSNIVGMAVNDEAHQQVAKDILSVLPPASFKLICDSNEAELIKYAHNSSGYAQIIFFNLLYDLAQKVNADWAVVNKALVNDPFIPNRYAQPVHKSGRGAGGHCFIKDFSALAGLYRELVGDSAGNDVFRTNEKKNIQLLLDSQKDLDLLKGVYGEEIGEK